MGSFSAGWGFLRVFQTIVAEARVECRFDFLINVFKKQKIKILTFMYLPAWRIIQTGGLSTASPRRARSMSGSEEEPCSFSVFREEVERDKVERG